MKRSLIVVGGGPAGMMAAIAAAEQGAGVLLLEGNEKLGKKLYITGKGRCNLTNDCAREDFLSNIPRNPRFLLSSFSQMDNHALMQRVERMGVPLVVERGGRVFPASGKASDITRALERRIAQLGVVTRVGDACLGLEVVDDTLVAVKAKSRRIPCDALVLATGGLSYPQTGSTGDGYRFASEAGHTIIPPRATLVPLETKDQWPKALTGLSLKNVELCAASGKKQLFKERGEMLFTHFGVSGPLVLSLSAHLPDALEGLSVFIDLKPALTQEQVAARILREIEAGQRRQLVTLLGSMMPHALAEAFAGVTGLDGAMPAHQVTREQRVRLADCMKRLPLAIAKTRPIDEAVVTRGGVDVREVDPKTMQSKLVRGLHFAGEMLDVDGYTGGFNMQIAFSTGYAAGYWAGKMKEDTL